MKINYRILKSHLILFSILFTFIFIAGCGSTTELTSDWNKSQIKIDGDASDWTENLKYLKDNNIAVGFKNNDSDLFVCLTTGDMSKVRQMFRGGFIVWIKPENGGKVFGIKYPFFDMSEMGNNFRRQNGVRENMGRENPGGFNERAIRNQKEIQIVNEDKRPLTEISLENKDGIKAALGYQNDQFVYELEVPIKSGKNFPYEIDAVNGEKLNLKFETGDMQRPNFNREEGGGEGEGDGGGSFGRGGRRGGGQKFGGGMRNEENQSKPIDVSIELTMAKSE